MLSSGQEFDEKCLDSKHILLGCTSIPVGKIKILYLSQFLFFWLAENSPLKGSIYIMQQTGFYYYKAEAVGQRRKIMFTIIRFAHIPCGHVQLKNI